MAVCQDWLVKAIGNESIDENQNLFAILEAGLVLKPHVFCWDWLMSQ